VAAEGYQVLPPGRQRSALRANASKTIHASTRSDGSNVSGFRRHARTGSQGSCNTLMKQNGAAPLDTPGWRQHSKLRTRAWSNPGARSALRPSVWRRQGECLRNPFPLPSNHRAEEIGPVSSQKAWWSCRCRPSTTGRFARIPGLIGATQAKPWSLAFSRLVMNCACRCRRLFSWGSEPLLATGSWLDCGWAVVARPAWVYLVLNMPGLSIRKVVTVRPAPEFLSTA